MGVWAIDGVELDDPKGRWRIEHASKVPAGANRRVTMLDVPARDGSIAVRQGVGTGTVSLTLAVFGEGAVLDARRSALVSLIQQARKITWSPAPERRISTNVLQSSVSDPERRGATALLIQASITTHPYWKEPNTAFSVPQTLVAGFRVEFPELAGSTGRLDDAWLRVTGPTKSLTLTSERGATGLHLNRAVNAGEYVFVDLARFVGYKSSRDSDWGLPSSEQIGLDFPVGGPLQVWPTVTDDPEKSQVSLVVGGSGFTSASKVSIKAARSFV